MIKKTVGRLKFKGDSAGAAKKRKLHQSISIDIVEARDEEVGDTSEELSLTSAPVTGTGRITSSGSTIHGHFTKFMDEIRPGDAMIVTHPTALQEEMKIVRMVLSNISVSISSGFSTDLISTTAFKYIKAPRDEISEESEKAKHLPKLHQNSEEAAFGTYASEGGNKFVYRVKKEGAFGGYKIVTESASSSSRESLLDKRMKKKSDRFCY